MTPVSNLSLLVSIGELFLDVFLLLWVCILTAVFIVVIVFISAPIHWITGTEKHQWILQRVYCFFCKLGQEKHERS